MYFASKLNLCYQNRFSTVGPDESFTMKIYSISRKLDEWLSEQGISELQYVFGFQFAKGTISQEEKTPILIQLHFRMPDRIDHLRCKNDLICFHLYPLIF